MALKADHRFIEARAVDKWIVGCDLGQTTDPTALCVLNHRIVPLDKWTPKGGGVFKQDRTEHFDVRHLERLPLGLAYPVQAQHVANVMARPPLNTGAKLVIDETGVGRAVGDIFDAAGLRPYRVTITAGLEVTQQDGRSWHVAKSHLISGVDARLHTGELGFAARLSDAGALADELKDFQRKVTAAGKATWSARTGAHDDLVLAVAIALWFATNMPVSGSEPLPF